MSLPAVPLSLARLSLALPLLVAGCGHGGGGGSGVTLGAGQYSVGAPRCLSTDAAPKYPDVAHKAALLDFTGLTAHTWDVGTVGDVSETLVDADCRLTIARRIARNGDGVFSLERRRTHTFEPAGCKLRVDNLGTVVELGQENGAPFVDQTGDDAGAEDLPFERRGIEGATDGAFDLLTAEATGLNELWATYGCANPDRLVIRLTPAP